jgi:hypothetical protein
LNCTVGELVPTMKGAIDEGSKRKLVEVERLRALDQNTINHLEQIEKELKKVDN